MGLCGSVYLPQWACVPSCHSDCKSLLLHAKMKTCVWYVCVWHAGCWSVSGVFSGLQASLVLWLSHQPVLVELFINLCLEYSGHMCATATDEPWAGADGGCVCVCVEAGWWWSKAVLTEMLPSSGILWPPPPLFVHIYTQEFSHTLPSPTQKTWLPMPPLGSCLTWKIRIYFVYSRKRTVDHSSHTGSTANMQSARGSNIQVMPQQCWKSNFIYMWWAN